MRPRVAAVGIAAGLSAVLLAAAGPGVHFPFDRAYGTYQNVEVDALPVTSGAIDVRLSSPENTVTLESGSLRLEPAEGGQHRARVNVVFSGEGQLVTQVSLGSLPARFEDRVRFPRQEHSVSGWVSIEAVDEGYRVVTDEFPDAVAIELESELAANLVKFCRSMSLFTAGDAGCDNLEQLLRHPRIPLPKPGSEFLVKASDLTDGERERLEVYLQGSKLLAPL